MLVEFRNKSLLLKYLGKVLINFRNWFLRSHINKIIKVLKGDIGKILYKIRICLLMIKNLEVKKEKI